MKTDQETIADLICEVERLDVLVNTYLGALVKKDSGFKLLLTQRDQDSKKARDFLMRALMAEGQLRAQKQPERVFDGTCSAVGRLRLVEGIDVRTPEGYYENVASHMFLKGLSGKKVRVEVHLEEKS